jgi:hypothetical protein
MKKPNIAVQRNATASITLLFLRTSPKAFQQTINTDAKITMVTVSRKVCTGSGAGTTKTERRSWSTHKKQESTNRNPAIQRASDSLDVSESEFDDMRLDDIE